MERPPRAPPAGLSVPSVIPSSIQVTVSPSGNAQANDNLLVGMQVGERIDVGGDQHIREQRAQSIHIHGDQHVHINGTQSPAREEADPISHFNVPFYTSLFGESRQAYLKRIHEVCFPDKNLWHIIAVQGIAGIGKSHLLMKYAHDHREEFSERCLWLDASNDRTLLKSFQELAERLKIIEATTHLMLRSIYQKLNKMGKCLLIFDNARTHKQITEYLPPAGVSQERFMILLSTTNAIEWQEYPNIVMSCDDQSLQQDTLNLIKAKTKESDKSVFRLARKLSYHSLAVVQALRYILACKVSIAEYLKEFAKSKKRLLEEMSGIQDKNVQSVYVAFNLNIEAVKKLNKGAVDVIYTCAYLYDRDIDRQQLTRYFSQGNNIKFNEIIKVLRAFSMIHITDAQGHFDIHQLLQLVIRLRIEERDWIERTIDMMISSVSRNQSSQGLSQAVDIMTDGFRYNRADQEKLEELKQQFIHVITVLEHAKRIHFRHVKLAFLSYSVGVYYLDVFYNIRLAKRYLHQAEKFQQDFSASTQERSKTYRQLSKAYLRNATTTKKHKLKSKYFDKAVEYLELLQDTKTCDNFTLFCDFANLYLRKIEYMDNFEIKEYSDDDKDQTSKKKRRRATKLPARVKTYGQIKKMARLYLDMAKEELKSNATDTKRAMLSHYYGNYYFRTYQFDLAIIAFTDAIELKRKMNDLRELARSYCELARSEVEKSKKEENERLKNGILQLALEHLRIALCAQINCFKTLNYFEISKTLDQLAEVYTTLGKFNLAIHCRVAVYNILQTLNRAKIENVRELIQLFCKIGRFDLGKRFIRLIKSEEIRDELKRTNSDLFNNQLDNYCVAKPDTESLLVTESSVSDLNHKLNLQLDLKNMSTQTNYPLDEVSESGLEDDDSNDDQNDAESDHDNQNSSSDDEKQPINAVKKHLTKRRRFPSESGVPSTHQGVAGVSQTLNKFFATKGQGSCFFHATFGQLIGSDYQVPNPMLYRQQWADLLKKFNGLDDPNMPASLRKGLETIFAMFLQTPEMHALNEVEEEFVVNLRKNVTASIDEAKRKAARLLATIEDVLLKPLNPDNRNLLSALLHNIQIDSESKAEYQQIKIQLKNAVRDIHVPTDLELTACLNILGAHKQYLRDKIFTHLELYVRCLPYEELRAVGKRINSKEIAKQFIYNPDLYNHYISIITKNQYYIFFEEIPILASLSRRNIHVWYQEANGRDVEIVFSPEQDIQIWMEQHFPERQHDLYGAPGSSIAIYHEGFLGHYCRGLHFSRANLERLNLVNGQLATVHAPGNIAPHSAMFPNLSPAPRQMGANLDLQFHS